MTDTSRPVLSVTEAATATGRSRRSIGRLLDQGRLDGAVRDATGWHIPVEALIAAGLPVYAPTPAVDTPTPSMPAPPTAPPPTDLDALRAELADWRRRAEVAEAIAAERAAALDDVRTALEMANRMLMPGTSAEGSSTGPSPTVTPSTPSTPSTPAPTPARRLFARYWRKQL